MSTKQHTHRPAECHDYPYSSPISDARLPNPAAHGNITRVERCRCGATRASNINGHHVERGPWSEPAALASDELHPAL